MADLKLKISEIKTAINEYKNRIDAIDTLIEDAYNRRHAITSAPVSLEDLGNYVREDMRRKGEVFAGRLRRQVKHIPCEYPTLDTMLASGFLFPFLTADRMIPVDVTDMGMFYYFGDAIAQRFTEALSSLEWPEGTIPVEERRAIVVKIDEEIATLKQQRAILAAELIDAGLAY